jgi:hypothetical protein
MISTMHFEYQKKKKPVLNEVCFERLQKTGKVHIHSVPFTNAYLGFLFV